MQGGLIIQTDNPIFGHQGEWRFCNKEESLGLPYQGHKTPSTSM